MLVNGQTASAAEIVAGAVQDLDVGVIVGSRTFGKGLIQNIQELPFRTALRYTVGRYYTPSGRCIQAVDYSPSESGTLNGKQKGEQERTVGTASFQKRVETSDNSIHHGKICTGLLYRAFLPRPVADSLSKPFHAENAC